jgi:hypothetical protein
VSHANRNLRLLRLFSASNTMPRLTAETIQARGTYLNPLKDREIDLRGPCFSLLPITVSPSSPCHFHLPIFIPIYLL